MCDKKKGLDIPVYSICALNFALCFYLFPKPTKSELKFIWPRPSSRKYDSLSCFSHNDVVGVKICVPAIRIFSGTSVHSPYAYGNENRWAAETIVLILYT